MWTAARLDGSQGRRRELRGPCAGRREGWSGQGSRDPGRPRFLFLSRVWRKTVFRVDATPGELTRIFRLTEGAAAASLAVPPRALRPAPPSPQGR